MGSPLCLKCNIASSACPAAATQCRRDSPVATVDEMSSAPRRRSSASYRSLWRLRGYVRPYTPQMLAMLACTTLAVAASTLIPLVLEAVVNGPMTAGNEPSSCRCS